MDSKRLLERIENGNLKLEDEFDGMTVHVELEAADKLGMLLKSIRFDSSRPPARVEAALRKQAAAIVELNYLEDLKVVEVDGSANAVQIRSQKPSKEGFTEVILRHGTSVALERRGSALHISKQVFERLSDDLERICLIP